MPEKNTLPLKERMAIPRSHMPEADATARSRNFEEVNRGLPPRTRCARRHAALNVRSRGASSSVR